MGFLNALVLVCLLRSQSVQAKHTNNLLPREDSEDVNTSSLAATAKSALRGVSPPESVLRIVDKGALESVDDPLEREFIYHPPGHEANVDEYPYFAHWSNAMCGASVIHDDILLTAGHCGKKAVEPLKRSQVRLLSKYREEGGITRKIAHLEVHPRFNQNVQEYDYQIIKLSKSVLVDNDGNPTGATIVKLNHNKDNPKPGDHIQAVGFGTTTPDGSTGNSRVLMDATLQSFTNSHCSKQYGPGKFVGDIMLCVGTSDGSADTCQGNVLSFVGCHIPLPRNTGHWTHRAPFSFGRTSR